MVNADIKNLVQRNWTKKFCILVIMPGTPKNERILVMCSLSVKNMNMT
jgi:hypothetical protein